MSKITVDIDYEIAEKIVVQELIQTRESLMNDLGAGHWVFAFNDQEQDDEQIQKHIDAIELLLKWYAPPVKLKELGLDD